MKKFLVLLAIVVQVYACVSSRRTMPYIPPGTFADTLRFLYSQKPSAWPKPLVDPSVRWTELGYLPTGPLAGRKDSLKALIDLGATLFFDPLLSGSNKISCATCHRPELSWTDHRARSLGHEDQMNRRNSPTILNTWFYRELFWDGRSKSLEDQAFSPINSETEMHSDMPSVITKLRRSKDYKPLFEKAYGLPEVSPETVTQALATFQRSITSQPSAFDHFVSGNAAALKDDELRGLHIFRTKAGCMNCHHGNMFSDDEFHNTGIDSYDQHQLDKGRYNFTKKDQDAGKFRTPSLRDVSRTGPWMHNGSISTLEDVISLYNSGMSPGNADKRLPGKDALIRPLLLTAAERSDLLAFLGAISADPVPFTQRTNGVSGN